MNVNASLRDQNKTKQQQQQQKKPKTKKKQQQQQKKQWSTIIYGQIRNFIYQSSADTIQFWQKLIRS